MSDSNTPATSQGPRTAILAVGGAALVGLGLAAGMLLRSPSTAPIVESAAPVPVASAASTATSAADSATTVTAAIASAPASVAAQAKPPIESRKAARRQEAARQHTNAAPPPTARTQPAPGCANCGTVDSVRTVQQKGEGSGVGAVAGGVLGGVLGNQVGKGQGKTAMTILGAIGGGVAGNEIEKQQRAETVYEVTIRMDDGSHRTLTQRSAPPTGTRVEVDGNSLTPINR